MYVPFDTLLPGDRVILEARGHRAEVFTVVSYTEFWKRAELKVTGRSKAITLGLNESEIAVGVELAPLPTGVAA